MNWKILAIKNRIELLNTHKAENGAIVRKLQRKLRRMEK